MSERWAGPGAPAGQYFIGGMAAPPPRRQNGLRVALVLLLVAIVGAVVWLVVATNGTAQRRAAPVDDSLTKVVTASDGRSRLTVPEGWRELAEEYREEDAVIAHGQVFQERYVMVTPYEKADYADFADFEEATVDDLTGTALTVDQGTPTTLGGRQAVRYEMSSSQDGVDALLWQTVVDGDGAYYRIIAWTLAERRAEAEPALRDVVATFEEITP